MITKNRADNRTRLKRHIRLTVSGTGQRPRLAIFRSLKHVYAQIIDDAAGKTLVTVSDLSKEYREQFKDVKGQAKIARLVGQLAARKAIEKQITTVVFDRSGYLYHGVVKATADGAREGGLKF
jgi:large subunit ribosomal protein L18